MARRSTLMAGCDCPYCGRIMWTVRENNVGRCKRCQRALLAAREAAAPLLDEIAKLRRELAEAGRP